MKWSRTINIVGAHAEGEIGRVITGGVLPISGDTMLERMNWLNEHGDHLRRFALFEPRGAAQMTVNLLTPACDPTADAGFIPMQGDGSHAMSGSNAICVTTVLLETGMIEMVEPQTTVTLDTPAGLIRANAQCLNGKVTTVDLDFFPSFSEKLDVPVLVEDFGEITVDVAFGGVYYILVNASQLSTSIKPASAQFLVKAGNQILRAAQQQITVQHPTIADFNQIEFCMFTDTEDADKNIYLNATIMPPGRLDRSPCGTGSAARLSVMHARGEIGVDTDVVMRSAIGSRFNTRIRGTTSVGDRAAVLPSIAGRAWIYSIGQYGVDPDDPFPLGFTLSDTWGDGIEHEIPEL